MINSTVRSAGPFAGDGSIANPTFPFSFKVFSATDVQVLRADASGVETILTGGYTVALNANQDVSPGGTVTLGGTLPTGSRLAITSNVAPLQPMQLTNGGGFFPRVLNDAADRLTILVQQIASRLSRSVTVPLTDGAAGLTLPTAAARAGKYLGFDANGAFAVLTGTGSGSSGGSSGGLVDAPTDGKLYGRKAGSWAEFVASSITFLNTGVGAILRPITDRFLEVVNVVDYGAKCDGQANDTAALRAASAEIVRRGGGRLVFPPAGVCIIGGNQGNAGIGPAPIDLTGIAHRVVIDGNGTILRAIDNARYGAFDPATGAARTSISTAPADQTAPFECAVRWYQCSGSLEINGLRVEGNNRKFVKGGQWGDTGYQIPNGGFHLIDSTGRMTLNDCDAFEMGQDGLLIRLPTTLTSSRTPFVANRCNFEYNGRQGCSQVGGRGARYNDCRFNYTGKAGLVSAPASGCDVEAENGNVNRDTIYDGCEFIGNAGAGFVADSGDSRGITFRRCRFIGTEGWAGWFNKPGIAVEDSLIVGAVVNLYPDANFLDNVVFTRCRFTDDPTLSPTGVVYGSRAADLGNSDASPLFDACTFRMVGSMTLPYHANRARYNNCTLSQTTSAMTVLTAIWTGYNLLTAPANSLNLANSIYVGAVTMNGTRQGPRQIQASGYTSNIAGGGVAAGASYNVALYGFDGRSSVLLFDVSGGGENGASDKPKVIVSSVTRRADGADVTLLNNGGAQSINFGYVAV